MPRKNALSCAYGARALKEESMRKVFVFALISALTIVPAMNVYAWEGYDPNSSENVRIHGQNEPREGEEIVVYDYSDASEHYCVVMSINDADSHTELHVFDGSANKYRMLKMHK
jgi:hypothetical protein